MDSEKIELTAEQLRDLRKSLWFNESDDDEARKLLIFSPQELIDYMIELETNTCDYVGDDDFDKATEEAHKWFKENP